MDVIHTALVVSDLERTRAFYEEVLGLEYHWDFTHDGVVNYYVGTEDGAEIQFKYDESDENPIEPAGVDHIALGVEDADETFERVVAESDCPVVLEPTTFEAANRRAAFVSDPDGYTVEFVAKVE